MEKLFNVYWKEIAIGEVLKENDEFIFRYINEGVNDANKIGFKYLIGFKNLDKEYRSKKLFPVFTSRIPPHNRHDINKILEKLDIKEYDELEILKKTNGKCYTDDIEVR